MSNLKFLRDSFENDHPMEPPVDLDALAYAPPEVRDQERLDRLATEIGQEAEQAIRESRALVPWQKAPLDELAEQILALTYGDMIEWTDSIWAGMPASGVPDAGALAKLLHGWAMAGKPIELAH